MLTISKTANRLIFKTLPLAGLIADLLPRVNLYFPAEPPAQPKLYRAANLPIEPGDIQTLRANGVSELWVDDNDYDQIKRFLADNLGTLLSDESHPPRDRLRVLNQVVSDTLRETFTSNAVPKSVATTRELATHMVELGVRSEIAVRDLARIAKHDYCTFTHSANVAGYATLLAKAMGIYATEDLRAIAAAGMLHDIGKLSVPNKILAKPGKLTSGEFTVVRKHPIRGFQLLRRERELSANQLMMVYQHHEWMNGKGYPVGCLGNDLHLWSRICAVVDVFEALTGKRPYRRPNTIVESLAIMERESGTHFDPEVFQCWKCHFGEASKA